MTGKRPAAQSESKAKKPRVDPYKKYCETVRGGLELSQVSPEVIKMLASMTELSLLTSKDKRHSYQASVVQMITDTIQAIGEEHEKSIAHQKSQIENCNTLRLEREAAVTEAKAELEVVKAATQAKKRALAANAQAFKAAKEGVAKAKGAVGAADKQIGEKQKAKDNLETMMTDLVTPLVQGTVVGDDARRSAENLLASLKKLSLLDESLLTAIPEAITKEPAARGAFDASVVSGLQEELDRRKASATEELAASTPKKEECQKQLLQAEATFEEAKKMQHVGAEEYTEARSAQSAAEGKVKEAQKALAQLDPQVKTLQKDLKKMEDKLADFYNGPRAALAELSERIEPTEAVEEAAATAVPGEAAAVEAAA